MAEKKMPKEELYARVVEALLRHAIDRVNVLVSQNDTLHRISCKINNDLDEMKKIAKGLRQEIADLGLERCTARRDKSDESAESAQGGESLSQGLSELRLKRLRRRRNQQRKRRGA